MQVHFLKNRIFFQKARAHFKLHDHFLKHAHTLKNYIGRFHKKIRTTNSVACMLGICTRAARANAKVCVPVTGRAGASGSLAVTLTVGDERT